MGAFKVAQMRARRHEVSCADPPHPGHEEKTFSRSTYPDIKVNPCLIGCKSGPEFFNFSTSLFLSLLQRFNLLKR